MTDKDKLVTLFEEWRVPYAPDEEDDDTIVLEADAWSENPKVAGYGGFVTHFTFDKDGGFIRIGIWE